MRLALALLSVALASPAAAQAPLCGGDAGAQLMPNVCVLADAARHLTRALAESPRACVALPPQAARAQACGEIRGRTRCDEGARHAVMAWSAAWSEAADATFDAWEGRPLLHVDVLASARAAREAARAWQVACGGAAASESARWEPYLRRVEAATTQDSLCAALDDVVGPTWSGSSARWVLNPLRPRLATLCPNAREHPGPSFARSSRALEVAEQLVSHVVALEGPVVIAARPVADPSLRPASCARLPYFVGTAAGPRLGEVCSVAPAYSTPPLSCEGDGAPHRAACGVFTTVERGAFGRDQWSALPEWPAARASVARHLTAHAPLPSTGATPIADADLRLDGRRRAGRSCERLAQQSDARLSAPVESLDIPDVRVLLASARCRGSDSGDERRKAVLELARVREAAIHAPAVRRSESASALVATAGLLLLSTNGYQAAGREMVRPLLQDPDAFERVVGVVAGGGAPDEAARRAASLMASRALARLVEVAIDEGSFALAGAALDAMQAASELARVDERERTLQRVERALLQVTLAIARGNASAARRATEDARELLDARGRRTSGDVRYEHEVRAREIELGIEPRPRELETGCAADFTRRGLVREAARARLPEERAAVLTELAQVLAAPPVTRGPCLRARGFREAETRAALARAELLVACLDEGDARCADSGEAAARELGDALLQAVSAFERAVDDRLVEGDVDRTRPLGLLAEEVRSVSVRAVTEERLTLLRSAGASAAALERLNWLAYSTPTCLAYPDLRVQLKWLAGRDVPRCVPLEAAPAEPGVTLAFVRYADGGRARYASWLRRGSQLQRRELGPAAALERRITDLVRALSDPSAPYDVEATPLAHELLGPSDALPRDAALTIVPDAGVAAVPFEVLAWHIGREDLRIRHALDVTPLGEEPHVAPSSPVVVVADPRFGPSDGSVGLTRLAGTRREAEAICSRFQCDTRRLERGGATESALFAAVQERSGRYGVVHLATHAVFTGTDAVAARTAILLAGVGDELPEVPLFASGADGLLEERELASLGIAYTELVVLSACGTSRGEARLGVRGLVRAARLSGARSVMGSLWSVDDEATGAWMGHFYERLAAGDGAATAARAAMRATRQRWPHPYFWAPFVLLEAQSTDSYR